MVRCYDCGKPIPDGQIIRQDVCIGRSSSPYGSSDYYSKVSLCPACAAQRNRFGVIDIGPIIDWIMKSKTRRIIIYCFFAMILFLCIVSGIINVHKTAKPKNNKIDQKQQISNKPTTSVFKKDNRLRLSGTIAKVEKVYVGSSDVVVLDITIMDNRVPGGLTKTFRAYSYSGSPLNIKTRDLDITKAIGREVDFVIEWHDDQWILVELVGK